MFSLWLEVALIMKTYPWLILNIMLTRAEVVGDVTEVAKEATEDVYWHQDPELPTGESLCISNVPSYEEADKNLSPFYKHVSIPVDKKKKDNFVHPAPGSFTLQDKGWGKSTQTIPVGMKIKQTYSRMVKGWVQDSLQDCALSWIQYNALCYQDTGVYAAIYEVCHIISATHVGLINAKGQYKIF